MGATTISVRKVCMADVSKPVYLLFNGDFVLERKRRQALALLEGTLQGICNSVREGGGRFAPSNSRFLAKLGESRSRAYYAAKFRFDGGKKENGFNVVFGPRGGDNAREMVEEIMDRTDAEKVGLPITVIRVGTCGMYYPIENGEKVKSTWGLKRRPESGYFRGFVGIANALSGEDMVVSDMEAGALATLQQKEQGKMNFGCVLGVSNLCINDGRSFAFGAVVVPRTAIDVTRADDADMLALARLFDSEARKRLGEGYSARFVPRPFPSMGRDGAELAIGAQLFNPFGDGFGRTARFVFGLSDRLQSYIESAAGWTVKKFDSKAHLERRRMFSTGDVRRELDGGVRERIVENADGVRRMLRDCTVITTRCLNKSTGVVVSEEEGGGAAAAPKRSNWEGALEGAIIVATRTGTQFAFNPLG